MIRDVTGESISRAVIVDASQFWTPHFGETEQNVSDWTERIQQLASQEFRTRDGRPVRLPLISVLEECDALLRERSGHDASSHLFDRPMALLLQKLESVENAIRSPIIWLVTSNRIDLTDRAALRRFGMRQVLFGSLRLSEATAVMEKKVPATMPIRSKLPRAATRSRLVSRVIGYLYGPDPPQALAEVQIANSKHRTLSRRDLVTPAVLEEAISSAVDQCLRRSRRKGRLVGLDAEDVIRFLDDHFVNLARSLRPHNVVEHCPEWFAGQSLHVTDVVSLARRRPSSLNQVS